MPCGDLNAQNPHEYECWAHYDDRVHRETVAIACSVLRLCWYARVVLVMFTSG